MYKVKQCNETNGLGKIVLMEKTFQTREEALAYLIDRIGFLENDLTSLGIAENEEDNFLAFYADSNLIGKVYGITSSLGIESSLELERC